MKKGVCGDVVPCTFDTSRIERYFPFNAMLK
jgi:hypothetical protein